MDKMVVPLVNIPSNHPVTLFRHLTQYAEDPRNHPVTAEKIIHAFAARHPQFPQAMVERAIKEVMQPAPTLAR